MSDGFFYIYILSNPLGVLYVGMTNDIRRRLAEHREGIHPKSYTVRHRCDRLVYVERLYDPGSTILREKEIKKWKRKKKEALIKSKNPG